MLTFYHNHYDFLKKKWNIISIVVEAQKGPILEALCILFSSPMYL